MMSLFEIEDEVSNGLSDTANVDDILFGIKERPLVYYENGGPPVVTDYKVLLNANNNNVLYMGKIYSPIRNQDIVEAVSDYPELRLSNVRNYYGKRFELTYTLPDTTFMLGPEETIFSLNIVNSYDGSSSLHVVGGLYVLVCSNGAKVGRMTYQFKRKHTSDIGRNELSGFIKDSVEYIHDRSHLIADKIWNNDDFYVRSQFKEMVKVFPKRKDNQIHPGIVALNSEYNLMDNRYPEQREFALFMAVTNMTTRPNQYGLGATYTKSLDSIIGEVFFN